MTTQTISVVANVAAESRWREWQARGAENDRRTAKKMSTLVLLILTALMIALFAQLA